MFNTTLLKSPHCIKSTEGQHLENWSMITMKGKVPFSALECNINLNYIALYQKKSPNVSALGM